ncbi:MAG: hypothetical protein JAZ03_22760 [Candidatus Thiodiazotropha taylori]|nr:hypothetical protein [Candidatus Thiodiazotropha taylori]MCW4336753.1 hypothetical protein [Candidatus Thiodiazotropha endolucinida]
MVVHRKYDMWVYFATVDLFAEYIFTFMKWNTKLTLQLPATVETNVRQSLRHCSSYDVFLINKYDVKYDAIAEKFLNQPGHCKMHHTTKEYASEVNYQTSFDHMHILENAGFTGDRQNSLLRLIMESSKWSFSPFP